MSFPDKILLLFLFCLLVSCSTSEIPDTAHNTLLEADSLYACGGLYSDTTALRDAVSRYEKSNRKRQYNDAIARLYYYLGRNHTLCNNDVEAVIHQADSLKALGREYSDSTTLASMSKRIDNAVYRHLYPDTYAGIMYHYGRLLLTSNNPASAMRCFLAVTNSKTTNHTIVGRAYSNISAICHQAKEYELAYQMSEKSSQQFMRANDTLAYYYALYEMTVELAEQSKKEETLALAKTIEQEYNHPSVTALVDLAKAILYQNVQQYDSSIVYANKELSFYIDEPTGLVIKAQAFSFLGIKDSAVFYASKTINATQNPLSHLKNAYYILQNDDISISKDSVNTLAAKRMDVSDILDKNHTEYSIAVLLLQQNGNRKNYIVMFFLLGIIMLIPLGFFIYATFQKIKEQHRNINFEKQRLLQQKNILYQQQQQIRQENFMLRQHNNDLKHTNELLEQSNTLLYKANFEKLNQRILALQQSDDWKKELCWSDFDMFCQLVNQNFFFLIRKLRVFNIKNEREIRLCVLVLIDIFKDNEMAALLYYGENSIRTIKMNIAKKLGTTSKNMRDSLIKIAVG